MNPQPERVEVEFERTVREMATAALHLRLTSAETFWYRRLLRLLMIACGLLVGDLFWRLRGGTSTVTEVVVAILIGGL